MENKRCKKCKSIIVKNNCGCNAKKRLGEGKNYFEENENEQIKQ